MIITRIPPSPTGAFHIGTLRTALFNYLFAKKNNGVMLFRSEDTDTERSRPEFEKQIFDGLVSMSLIPANTKIVRQSERTNLYKKALQTLLNAGTAYYCFMTVEELEAEKMEQELQHAPPRYSGKYRDYPREEAEKRIAAGERAVIRLKIEYGRSISWHDLIRGEVTVHSSQLDDFVIAKGLDQPLYHLAVVVDDIHMGVTHILRGEDHVSNTPKQILIYEALGAPLPQFGHLPLILNADKSKLSKRKNSVSVQNYLEKGYLKEALINFLALIGWNPGGEQEVFSLDELEKIFSLEGVQKSGAVFNLEKLDWFNKEWMKRIAFDDLMVLVKPFLEKNIGIVVDTDMLQKAVLLELGRAATLFEMAENIAFLFEVTLQYDKELLVWKKSTATDAKEKLQEIAGIISAIKEHEWQKDVIEKIITAWLDSKQYQKGDVLWPLRVALSGKERSPSPFEILSALSKDQALLRVQHAIELLG